MEKRVSVLICVRNGEPYLTQALDSIRDQTYQNWECIVVDDSSADRTPEILHRYAAEDSRFHLLQNQCNLRVPASLNRALALADGEYIVRMDADDISRRDRIARQVAFMEANANLEVSCCRNFLLQNGKILPGSNAWRTDHEAVQALFLFFNPIVHPGVIAKTDVMKRISYDPTYSCCEDLNFWIRILAEGGNIGIQNEYLICYRLHGKQVTATSAAAQREQHRQIISRLYREHGLLLSQEEEEFLTYGAFFRDKPDVEALTDLSRRILKKTAQEAWLSGDAVRYAVFEVLMEYKRIGVPVARLLLPAAGLGPRFLTRELHRRRRALRLDRKLRTNAMKLFAMEGYICESSKE